MIKQNPAVDHQDVALEVSQGDLVDWDLHKTSLYWFVLKKLDKKVNWERHTAPIKWTRIKLLGRGVTLLAKIYFTWS